MRHQRHPRRLYLRLFFGAVLAAGAAAQQPVPPPAPANQGVPAGQAASTELPVHTLLSALPEAAACGAPDWIVPGMRLSTFSSVSSSPTVGPDGRMGKGTAGAGWDITDVVAVEPGVVVLTMRSFLNANGQQGPAMPNGSRSILVHPSGCDFFLHPRLLEQLQDSSKDGISLRKGTTTHRGTQYKTITSTVEIPGTRLISVYDLTSGVQLSHNSGTYTQAPSFDPNRQNILANNQFHGARRLALPWTAGELPAWVKKMRRASYRGTRIDSGTPQMGLGRLVTNISLEFIPRQAGATFVLFDLKLTQQMEGLPPMDATTIPVAYGPGSKDALWIDPAVLATLRTGQVIDRDGQIGVDLGVEHAGKARDGRSVVVIGERSAGFQTSATYLLSDGRLLATQMVQRSASTGGTVTTSLELVGIDG
ncbi:MAG: hypothetical protein IPN34_20200 [Planctomycetes bacterium]|nr:hypothetical protein [Planctomycetota bacterium]